MIFIAEEADGAQILRITARAGVFSTEEVQCVADIWQEYIKLGVQASGYTFFVDKDENKALGFACYGPRYLTDRVYDLYWIAVDPSARRLGVGRRLMERVEASVRAKGGRILAIETSSTEKFAGTRAFYLAAGYKHEASLADLYAENDDLLIYTKRL